MLNEQGKPELVRDSRGEVVRSRLDETTLRAIAQATRGAYYPLGPLGEGLAKVRLALETISPAQPRPRHASSGWTVSIGRWQGYWSCW